MAKTTRAVAKNPLKTPLAVNSSTAALYRYLVESVTEYAIFAVSPHGIVISWNAGATRAFGYSKDEIVGTNFGLIFTPEDRAIGAPEWEMQAAEEFGRIDKERWHVRKDGSRFWAANIMQPLRDDNGTLSGFTKIVRDRTERHQFSETLRLSEEQLRLLVEGVTNYALFSVDMTGMITLWNPGAQEVYGYTAEEIVGEDFSTLYSVDNAADVAPEAHLRDATLAGVSVNQGWHVRKGGTRFFASGRISRMAPAEDHPESRGFVIVSHDVTEQKQLEETLRRTSFYDELTGLPNRTMFLEHLRRTVAHTQRHSEMFAVIFLDVDNFKIVNDTFGHHIADDLLKQLGSRLRRHLRDEDVLARLGGDEFAILVTDLKDPTEVDTLAERLQMALETPFVFDEQDVTMTASLGICLGPSEDRSADDLLRDADIAMYAAKARGRANHMVFDPEMHKRVIALHRLEMDLRRAARHDEFRIVYQPIVDLRTASTIGFEALVRWQHPTRGLLLPSDFLAVAHTTGIIIAIDRWVLLHACQRVSAWQSRHHSMEKLTLSVNMSAKQFMRADLVPYVTEVLTETQFSGELRLEITEHTIMEQADTAIATILRLRDLGVSVYIDDFGTGYSSLSYLADLPVAALKIDRSFVHQMIARPRAAGIIKSIIQLGQDLNVQAIAEGIETIAEFEGLRTFGCGFGQGYLFSKPVKWNVATEMIGVALT